MSTRSNLSHCLPHMVRYPSRYLRQETAHALQMDLST